MISVGRKLDDAVVVVTGASSGIGRATGLAFADRGRGWWWPRAGPMPWRNWHGNARQPGGQALAVPTDMTDEAAVAELARRPVERFGRIDVWVNNAGVYLLGLLEATPPEAFRRVLETNFLGYVHGARAVLPLPRAGSRRADQQRLGLLPRRRALAHRLCEQQVRRPGVLRGAPSGAC